MVDSIDGRYSYGGQPISEGGQARVFKGFDHAVSAPVAVKVFDLGDRDIDDVHLATWQLELQAYQSLPQHDHLTRVQAFGRLSSGVPYLVLEWLDGDLLEALPTLDIAGWDDFWPIARDILAGLSVIHRHGYIHRDIKPKNILISPDKRYKVADFGTVRLRPESDFVNTFAFYGSQPFSAPEFGTLKPTPAYDVYSFAVLVTACLSQSALTTPHEVLEAFSELDLPDGIAQTLEKCLSFAPEDRPKSATILLKELSTIQATRGNRPGQQWRMHLEVPPNVLTYYAQLTSNESASVDDLLGDLRDSPRFEFDKSADSNGDVRIAGRSLIAYATVVSNRPWQLRVRKLVRPFRRHLDDAHQTWWKPKVVLTPAAPSDVSAAARLLSEFTSALHEFEATKLAAHGAHDRNFFGQLGRVLDAKEQLTRHSQKAIRFTAARRVGRRIYLNVDADVEVVPNEARLIRDAFKQKLFCEVETLTNQELVLYVTKGELRELPQNGLLEVDAELTRSKLRRERAALDAVVRGSSSRSDLGDMLVAPQLSRVAVGDPATITFANKNLDDDKKMAVAKSVDLKDLLIVEGPPGTGKTTYIAELIGQQLARSSDSKILLAAQTHIALDNALARVQLQNPTAKFLRIGSVAKFDSGSEPWSIPAQLSLWRDETIDCGRRFVDQLAHTLGVSPANDSAERIAAHLEASMHRATELISQRSNLSSRRQDLRELVTQRDDRIRRVMDHLELVERTAASASHDQIDPQINELLDRGLALVATIEATGDLGTQLVAMDLQVERLSAELDSVEAGIQKNTASLRQIVGAGTAMTVEQMIASVLSINAESRTQITKLDEILDDWTSRLDTDASLHAVLLARADIVATTCVALTGVRGAGEIPFDLCLIDEASKASSTELLVPMASSKRWILVGDDKQLPPFVERELEDESFLATFELTRAEINEVLFTRLADGLPEENRITLSQQHRMQPDIGNLISRVFYGGRLQSPLRAVDPIVQACFGAPVTWLDTSDRNDRHERVLGTTVENRTEARLIIDELIKLNRLAELSDQLGKKVALLSGYEAQSKLLADLLAPHRLSLSKLDVFVATVDSFQGQEADICFFSLTRSNSTGEIGFLRSAARLNVALSRARDALVIVGDSSMMSQHSSAKKSPIGDVLQHLRTESGCIVRQVTNE